MRMFVVGGTAVPMSGPMYVFPKGSESKIVLDSQLAK